MLTTCTVSFPRNRRSVGALPVNPCARRSATRPVFATVGLLAIDGLYFNRGFTVAVHGRVTLPRRRPPRRAIETQPRRNQELDQAETIQLDRFGDDGAPSLASRIATHPSRREKPL